LGKTADEPSQRLSSGGRELSEPTSGKVTKCEEAVEPGLEEERKKWEAERAE
jgi:hypothetical protein